VSPLNFLLPLPLLSLGIAPREDIARDRVDLIELNHFYNEHGQLVFDQIIFYDWCPVAGRFQVRAWRMVKSPSQLPQRDWQRGGWSALWQDGDQTRLIYASAYRETWTQYDPELVEREYLPKERRKELRAARANKPRPTTIAGSGPAGTNAPAGQLAGAGAGPPAIRPASATSAAP
jgi:hypothetical protein